MTKRFITVMLAVFILLSACAKQTSLADTRWRVINLDGETALQDVVVTLNFDKEAIGGSDGCNTYGGSYTIDGTTIKFGSDLFSTMMYCTDEIMTQANTFYDVLKQIDSFHVDSQLLTLFNADGKKLAELIPFSE